VEYNVLRADLRRRFSTKEAPVSARRQLQFTDESVFSTASFPFPSSRLSTYFCPPLSAMICGASRPSGTLADCCPVATVVGGVLVTIFAPIRG
jgi:hypothetical protein